MAACAIVKAWFKAPVAGGKNHRLIRVERSRIADLSVYLEFKAHDRV